MLRILLVLVVVMVVGTFSYPHNFENDYDLSLGAIDNESILLEKLKKLEQPESHRVERTAFVHVKSARQKDKRYASYLTLCHFKICNMGRKRTTRYFHLITSLDNAT